MLAHAAIYEIPDGHPQRVLGETKRRTKKERLEIPEKDKPRTIDFLVAINQKLWKDIKYTIRLEPGVQTPEESPHQTQWLVSRLPLGCCASCCVTAASRRDL